MNEQSSLLLNGLRLHLSEIEGREKIFFEFSPILAVSFNVMKTLITLALGAVFALSGVASAQPGYPPNYHQGGPGYGGHGPGYGGGHRHGRPRMNTEARAQLRLRQLGYYYGSIDGSFGHQSRRALVRFQRDHHLPRTGWLDYRTLRALGLR